MLLLSPSPTPKFWPTRPMQRKKFSAIEPRNSSQKKSRNTDSPAGRGGGGAGRDMGTTVSGGLGSGGVCGGSKGSGMGLFLPGARSTLQVLQHFAQRDQPLAANLLDAERFQQPPAQLR